MGQCPHNWSQTADINSGKMPISIPHKFSYKYAHDVCSTNTRSLAEQKGRGERGMKYEKPATGCQSIKPFHLDRRWWHTGLDFLLPPRCILCGQPSAAVCICGPCKLELPWTGIHCRQCGLPLTSPQDDICGSCIQSPPPFTRTVCPLRYEFPADRLVQLFKFNRQLACGRILSHLLCEYALESESDFPDVLIPVPLHNWRMIKRGFNQAYELGAYISKVLDIPLLATSLRRHRNTQAQSGLSSKQRRKNVRGAFYWHGSKQAGVHVALIDDVMTTGTTVSECARVLTRAGAKQVDVWVTARAIAGGRH